MENLDTLDALDTAQLTLDCSKIYFGQLSASQQLSSALMSKIIAACKVEAIRQHVGVIELERLVKAFVETKRHLDFDCRLGIHFSLEIISNIASAIEPAKAASFRTTPVSFANGSLGLNPQLIQRSMEQLVAEFYNLSADEFIREFLLIHPYGDGNGRTAFVLYNFITNRMSNPQPLPDYFKEV